MKIRRPEYVAPTELTFVLGLISTKMSRLRRLAFAARPRKMSCRHRFNTLDAAQTRGISDGRPQISGLQVGVIRQNLLFRHVAAQQLQQELDRVAQPANARFSVADIRVNRDAGKQLLARHAAKMTPAQCRCKARFGRAEAEEKTSEAVIQKIIDELPVP